MGQGAWILTQHSGKLNGLNPFYELNAALVFTDGNCNCNAGCNYCQPGIHQAHLSHLLVKLISMNLWPKVKIKFPTTIKGQIYIPSINTTLWIGCVAMMFYFRKSEHMEAAYGFSIIIAMTMMISMMF